MSGLKYFIIDHPALAGAADKYCIIRVDCGRVIDSWSRSLFAHEWLLPDGRFKAPENLRVDEQKKRAGVIADIAAENPIKRPFLGIGLLETVEFCMGRAEFLTLADMGAEHIDVHIRKDQEKDFQSFVCGLPLNA